MYNKLTRMFIWHIISKYCYYRYCVYISTCIWLSIVSLNLFLSFFSIFSYPSFLYFLIFLFYIFLSFFSIFSYPSLLYFLILFSIFSYPSFLYFLILIFYLFLSFFSIFSYPYFLSFLILLDRDLYDIPRIVWMVFETQSFSYCKRKITPVYKQWLVTFTMYYFQDWYISHRVSVYLWIFCTGTSKRASQYVHTRRVV